MTAQACDLTSATSAAKLSRSAVRWSLTAAKFMAASSISRTNSDATRFTCARSAATRPDDRSCTTRTSKRSIRRARHFFERTTSATSSSRWLPHDHQRRCRSGRRRRPRGCCQGTFHPLQAHRSRLDRLHACLNVDALSRRAVFVWEAVGTVQPPFRNEKTPYPTPQMA